MTDKYTRTSVAGKTKSNASGGKGKAAHKSKKDYYARMVGKETKRTGTHRVHNVSENFKDAYTLDQKTTFKEVDVK